MTVSSNTGLESETGVTASNGRERGPWPPAIQCNIPNQTADFATSLFFSSPAQTDPSLPSSLPSQCTYHEEVCQLGLLQVEALHQLRPLHQEESEAGQGAPTADFLQPEGVKLPVVNASKHGGELDDGEVGNSMLIS